MPAPRKRPRPIYDESQWHVDKRINISLIFAIMVQFGIFVAAWTQLQSDVSLTKSAVKALSQSGKARDEKLEELIGVKRDIKYLVEGLKRMEDTVTGILKYEFDRSRDSAQARRKN